ncbi:30S ribosomal protein S20 [Thermodesulfovibrionales bacterium]|nr:30S ribosomal protein S20 [Thermodesulfovibrionales bacterium]MCL0040473.1 30S ribosomal protein S20 [Thermodesulfovibrionales bacterium]
MADKTAPKKKLSVIKRARQSEKRKLRNQSVKTKIKTYTIKAEKALLSKERDNIDKTLKEAVKTISSAVSKGITHKNTASRKISRLAKKAFLLSGQEEKISLKKQEQEASVSGQETSPKSKV